MPEPTVRMPERPIQVRGLGVRYGANRVFEDVDLDVPTGAIYALLGRNGCGKTSFVRCLLGQQRPAQGSIRILGHDAWRERRRALERVAVVPERPDVPPRMTVRDLFRFSRRVHRSWDGGRAEELLSQLEIPPSVAFGQLSRGQQTLTVLAAAIACRPDLLVLDDPLLGLDPVARRTFVEELIGESADRGTPVFLTTQQLTEIESLADHVGVLHQGRLIVDEPLEQLRGRFRRLHFQSGIAKSDIEPYRPLSSAVRSWGTEAVVAAYGKETAVSASIATPSAMSLEEIFVALAGEGEMNGGVR